jgi:internalin A
LAGLRLERLPENIRELRLLQHLDLSDCAALTDVQGLAGLTELRELNLGWCFALTEVQVLAGLTGLQQLDLSFCKALTDLQGLAGLTGLQRLYLRGCLLECAPERCPLPSSGSLAFVRADRLRSAPAELGSSSDDDNALPRIRAWQQDLGAGEAASSTLKLFILGNGWVGKTQISRRLRGETFDPSVPSTHGIQQFSVRLFDGTEEEPAVDAHVWDFGGQDVYLGTHALFVDRHAIFVLCWNPEYENTKDFTQHGTVMRNRPLAYWLAYIESLVSADTPVLLVQTQCDREDDVRAVPYNGTHGLKRVKALACRQSVPTPMGIDSGSLSVRAASDATQARIGDAVNILVLKKAQAADAAAALGLIQSLPKVPPLATEGTVGTRVNVFA